MMIRSKKTSKDLIFTTFAADEILNVPLGTVKAIHVNEGKEDPNCIFVQLGNSGKIKQIERSNFYRQFSQSRQNKSKDLRVEQIDSNEYKVTAPYYVGAKPGVVKIGQNKKITCNCQDFQDQLEAFSGQIACCSHVYSVLRIFGHDCLNTYLSN